MHKTLLVELNAALDELRMCRVSISEVSESDLDALDVLFTLDGYVYGLGDRVARGGQIDSVQCERLKQIRFRSGSTQLLTGGTDSVETGTHAALQRLASAIAGVAARTIEVACQ